MKIKSIISKVKEYFKMPNDMIIAISDVRATGIRHKEGVFFDEEIARENFSFDKIVLADGTHTDYKSLVKKMAKSAPRQFFRPRIFITLHANQNQKDYRKFEDAVSISNPREIYFLYSPFISTINGLELFEDEKGFREYQRGFFIYSDYSSTIFGLYFMDMCLGLETIDKKLSDIDYETFQSEIEKLKNSDFNPLEQFEILSDQEKEDIRFAWSKPFCEKIFIVSPTKLSFRVTEFKINHNYNYPNIIIRGCEKYIDSLDYFKNYRKKKLDAIDNFFLRTYEKSKILDHTTVLNGSVGDFFITILSMQLFCVGVVVGICFFPYNIFLGEDIWYNSIFFLIYLIAAKQIAFFLQIDIFVILYKRIQNLFRKK